MSHNASLIAAINHTLAALSVLPSHHSTCNCDLTTLHHAHVAGSLCLAHKLANLHGAILESEFHSLFTTDELTLLTAQIYQHTSEQDQELEDLIPEIRDQYIALSNEINNHGNENLRLARHLRGERMLVRNLERRVEELEGKIEKLEGMIQNGPHQANDKEQKNYGDGISRLLVIVVIIGLLVAHWKQISKIIAGFF